MRNFAVETTPLVGVLVIKPQRVVDERGFFAETWNRVMMADCGVSIDFVQDNHSMSVQAGTVRGLHFQAPPHAQDKLIRCGRGRLLDVAVDIRRNSPSFGQWYGHELSAGNGVQMLIPKGFLHGFITREPDTEIVYKCSDYYAPDCDGAVYFEDGDIKIDWNIVTPPILSEKDARAPFLRDFVSPFVWSGQT